MGYPELPQDSDSGGDDLHKYHNHISNARGAIPSDDSDNDEVDPYNGYQPLPINDQGDDTLESYNYLIDDVQPTMNEESNLPTIESIDAEIERQLWNEPRPRELQIEIDSQQIMSAMANVTLPNAHIPEWAMGDDAERWKDELLERIRQRTGKNLNNNAEKNNSI